MLNACNQRDIVEKVADLIIDPDYEGQPISALELKMTDLIREFSKTYGSEEQIASLIYETAKEYGLDAEDSTYFNIESIKSKLDSATYNIQQIDELETSPEQIVDASQIKYRRDASIEAISKYFGLAQEVEAQFRNITNEHLFDCLFINRGSLNTKLGNVSNTTELNNNIRIYQTILLKDIVTYINNILKNAPNISVDSSIQELLDNPVLYDNNNKYTGILETLAPLIDTYIRRPLNGHTDLLREIYNATRTSDSNAQLKLNAFYATVLLDNFDVYISSVLSKAIKIKDFGQKTGENKYQIADKTAKVSTTWRVSENIFVESEADAITKLAINTSKLHNWNSTDAKDGFYLHFSDFQHIVAKVKDLVYNPLIGNIVFNEDFKEFYPDLYNKIPQELKGKSLKTLIAISLRNPKKYYSIMFDILSNNTFKMDNPNIYKNFTQDELNKLYSLNVEIFNGNNSLRQLMFNSTGANYYEYITQQANSIYNVKFVQYYKDENGKIQIRTLLDQGVYNLKRKVERTINNNNTVKVIKDINGFRNSLNIHENRSKKGFLTSITFIIPDTKIKVQVYASGDVKFTNSENFTEITPTLEEVLPFIDSVLKLNLQNNQDLLEALKEVFKSTVNVCNSLLKFASRITFTRWFSAFELQNTNDASLLIKSTYGENRAPEYNYELDELGMVHPIDVETLNLISIAKANLEGLTVSTQVKNGEGNSKSSQTYSRLLGTLMSQFELLEKRPDSISNSFLILTNPEFLKGVYTAEEFYDPSNESKPTKDMNVDEMAYAQIVYDFIGGLMNQKNKLVGNGHILLLPSVNSDKSTIGRLLNNLNIQIKINGVQKALKDLNSNELETLIAQEFGTFYERMYNKICSDWETLEDFMISRGYLVGKLFSDGFKNGFIQLNSTFSSLNTGFATPVEFVKAQVLEYNKTHRLHPLELIDQIHYKNIKGSLGINHSIMAQIARFKPNSKIFIGNTILDNYPTAEQFWQRKRTEVLKGLLKYNFKINTSESNQAELAYIQENYKDWINSSGNVILARVNINGTVFDITSNSDLIKVGITIDTLDLMREHIQLNPIFEQYNYLDYLITQEFMNSTVGSFVAHPEKSKSLDVLEQEAAHFSAQMKRNVSFTAAMHAFQLNTLRGIPETYNIAVIEDIHDYRGTVTGVVGDIKAFDGATFVNPFVVILENNSLGGARVGITKKQFVHFKNVATGTGGIIKTAGFGLTNDWIRNSPFLEKMMEKMTNHKWLNEDSTPFITDITRNYRGEKINYKDFYFKRNGRFYQIIDIQSTGNNIYSRTLQEIDNNGNPVDDSFLEENIVVETNYQLWNLFGGKNSMDLINGELIPSNTSVENVVTAMNSIGTVKSNTVETQDDIWQALKMVDVHYLCTAGAVKQGGANINSVSRFKLDDDIPYDIQKIYMYQSGIQLDKSHQADDADISLMTQVVSACASRGYTFETALELYKSLKQSTEIKAKKHLDAFRNLFKSEFEKDQDNSNENIKQVEKDNIVFQEVLMESIIKAIATSNGTNFVKTIALDLVERAKQGEKISYADAIIPLSDNTMYRKVFSIVDSYLTKMGIKQKIPGTLSVLTTSHEVMKLYNGRKYESFENPNAELEVIQQTTLPVYDVTNPQSNITNLELGRNYFITRNVNTEVIDSEGNIQTLITQETKSELISLPNEYQQLKRDVKEGKVVKVVEDIKTGRNLAGYNVRFQTNKGNFQLADIDSISALFNLNKLEDNWSGVQGDVDVLKELYGKYLKINPDITLENAEIYRTNLKIKLRRWLQRDLANLSKDSPNIIEQYNELISTKEDTREWYNKYAQWVNIILGRNDGNQLELKGVKITVNNSNYKSVNMQVHNILKNSQMVSIDDKLYTVDKNSLQEFAYEVIMPKVFATKYGLSEFDDLNTIQNDPDYFIKQYLTRQTTKVRPNQFTIEFKRANGDHVYILTKNQLPNSGLTKLPGVETSLDSDGTIYRLDSDGNIMYPMSSDSEIYVDNMGNQVIVSDDIKHYVNELDYDTVKLSNNLTNYQSTLPDIVKILKESTNKEANFFGKYIYENKAIGILQSNREYHSLTLENYRNADENNPIIRMGKEKHTSFLRSLDIIAARTPGQSMQSYMPMKVVAFENADINTAYVSTYQILLQGSDFDIDCVSLATFDISPNGILELWSPYAKITNTQMLKASESLPMPTGKKLEFTITNRSREYLPFFEMYGDLFNIRHARKQNNDTKEWELSSKEISITLNLNTPEQIYKFGRMLKTTKTLMKPSDKDFRTFAESINNDNLNLTTKEQVENLFKELKKIIDRHNLYLDKISVNKLSRIINNNTIKSIYDGIINPVNQIQAQTSVDGTVGPLKAESAKSIEGKEAKNRTPGNFINKLQSIWENQIGKDSVGICAVGLKTFFALTAYSNYVLNYGTPEQQGRLLLGSNHKGYILGGKLYKTLANIRSNNPNTITNLNVLSTLSQVTNDNDAVLALSALLSLAVDNAKELDLSKLNASTKTIGMYIYGITIGMEFKDIAKLIMSPTGLMVSSLLNGNVFTGVKETIQAKSIFTYFDKIPKNLINKFDKNSDLSGSNIGQNPLQVFTREFREIYKADEKLSIETIIAKFGKENYTIDEKIKILESLRNKYRSTSDYGRKLYNQLIDTVEEYVINLSNIDYNILEDLKTVAEGAEELRILGQILSLNQGIKTDPEGLVTQINLIERAIYNITKNTNDIIDIKKFVQDEAYRNSKIEAYEKIKHSFNILEAVSTVPHFMGYLELLAVATKEQEQSFKFRSSRSMSLDLSISLNYYNEKKIIKGIEYYVGDYLRKQFLLQKGVVVTIPKGNKAFNKLGNMYTLKEDTPVYLGTDHGAATFRMFMETQVIPDLQAGRVVPNSDFSTVSNNKFIRDLINDTSTNTVLGNTTVVYTLPINMLPRTESDTMILNSYKIEFNKLASYQYQYNVSSFDQNGVETTTLSQPIPIVDLFTYYAMIANSWKLSENSLVPILEQFQNKGIIQEFHKFEKDFDRSRKTLKIGYTANLTSESILSDTILISFNDILPYVAPKASPYSSYSKYIRARNKNTHKYQLMQKLYGEDLEHDLYGLINNYQFKPIANSNYFTTGNVDRPTDVIVITTQDNSDCHVVYDKGSKIITDALINGKEIGLKDKTMPMKKVNGIETIDTNILKYLIEDKKSKC